MVLKFDDILTGIKAAYKGMRVALSTPKILRYFYKSFLFLAITMTLLYLVVKILVLTPLYIIKYSTLGIQYIFEVNLISIEKGLESSLTFIDETLYSLPLSCLFFVRYVYPYPMNNIFLVSLATVSPNLHSTLINKEYKIDYWDELKYCIKRNSKRIVFFIIIHLLSKVPHIGILVIPFASFYLTSKIIGLPLALSFSLVPLIFHSAQSPSYFILKLFFGCRALVRELLEPYFGRLNINAKERKLFFKGLDGLTFGFSIVFYLFILIPFIGPVFFVFAQSAVVCLLAKLIEAPKWSSKIVGHNQPSENTKRIKDE